MEASDVQQSYTLTELEEKFPRVWQELYETWSRAAVDDQWWDSVYEDALTMGRILGIEIRQTKHTHIFFSDFYSQGAGACWEGSYSYEKGAHRAIREAAPTEKALHDIADALYHVQKKNRYSLYADSNHRGHYYHPNSMTVSVQSHYTMSNDAEEVVTDALRDFAYWIHSSLRAEYEYMTSKERFHEDKADERFTEDGNAVP